LIGWATVESDRKNRAYRRALTLGLTLAEIFVLILFVLLLAFAASYEREREALVEIPKLKSHADQAAAYAVRLREENEYLKKHIPSSPDKFDDFFRELTLCEADRKKLQNQFEQIAGTGPGDLAKCQSRLTDSEREKERLNGQNLNLRERMAAEGHGTELPPCWTTPEGKIRYTFDVTLVSDGVIVHDNPPHQDEEQQVIKGVVLDKDLDAAAFLEVTNKPYAWAQAHKCAIFVRVYDNTGPGEKALYKARLRTVEAHFYKLETQRVGNSAEALAP
jgi:hypothetical protein